ncbi:FecR family protein [Dyadobacter soli]|uniref:FecR family protein n=1 Tax=Dyadobacter soli TaxID=659014 RepID=A0A1G7GE75_9BACT|nr:FecR domain-containing protein [Dyadobacter soli]SDE86395.1 FecR family protein [Dyadobacter soli]
MKLQVTSDLLFNYFAGQTTPLQNELIEDWAKTSENRELFFVYLDEWEARCPQYIADLDTALERHRAGLEQRLHAGTCDDQTLTAETEIFENEHKNLIFHKRWLAAAVALIVLGTSVIFAKDWLFYQKHSTAFGEIRTVALADGSQVTLNAHSSLLVPRFGFDRFSREVVLKGEAEFSVTHAPDDRDFTVKTASGFDVVVLGTEFVVSTRESASKVVLTKGKVRLLYGELQHRKALTLKPGELVTFDEQGNANLRQTQQPEDYSAWKKHRFIFDQTPLADLAPLFRDHFGVELRIADSTVARMTITGTFTARTDDMLLEFLKEAARLRVHREGKTVTLLRPAAL